MTSNMELLLPTFNVDIGSQDNQCIGQAIELEPKEEEGSLAIKKFVKSGTMVGQVLLSSMKESKAAISAPVSKEAQVI